MEDQRITPLQLKKALKKQKFSRRRIGVILKELDYATDEDIRWALEKLNRRIGDILKDRQSISEYDLHCALTMQHYDSLND